MITLLRNATLRKVLIGLSVVLNIFLGGLIGGYFLHPHPPGLYGVLVKLSGSLSSQDHETFWTVIDRDRSHSEAALQKVRAARMALNRTIAVEPFNPATTRAALAAWNDDWADYVKIFGDSFVDALEQISPEGRARIAAAIARLPHGRSHRETDDAGAGGKP